MKSLLKNVDIILSTQWSNLELFFLLEAMIKMVSLDFTMNRKELEYKLR